MTEAGALSAWAVVIALGAFHGANPSMGWLFAVSNGMFARRASAVFAALPPIAFGHLFAMALVLLPVAAISTLATAFTPVRTGAAVAIIAVGVYRLFVRRHPRILSRIGAGNLMLWSFVMATAHGAALMLVPVYFGMASMPKGLMSSTIGGDHSAHLTVVASAGHGLGLAAEVAVVHTIAMLVVAAAIAWVVYRFVGVSLLHQMWFNVDVVWAIALIAAGIITIV